MAIASSRWARYHHPAPVVVARLKKHGIAVLKTEDWGSILIEAPDQIR
jgi:beta-lactamase superfamily II metal-dependent hydrolase